MTEVAGLAGAAGVTGLAGRTAWPVTGTGAVASIGRTAEEIFTSLCAGRSGRNALRGFDPGWYSCRALYEIDDRGPAGDRPGRATHFLLDAIGQALADAGLGPDLATVPVLVGTGLRELRSVELWSRDGGSPPAGAFGFGAALRDRFGAVRSYTYANACSASLYALAMGTDLLASGAADTVVVAGVDVVTESMFGMADRLQSVPPDRVRPFDRNRLGTILGEGAAAVVLSRPVDGRAVDGRPVDGRPVDGRPVDGRTVDGRGVRGWVRGVEVGCDAFHVTAPDPAGLALTMAGAHRRAGVSPADIDLVLLHGTGTPANDTAEAVALAEVFGADAKNPLMTAIKSLTGHTSGASGLHSLITALTSMRQGLVPPTATLQDPIDEVAGFRIVRGQAEPARLGLAQVNAFGFGGLNAVAIVEAAR